MDVRKNPFLSKTKDNPFYYSNVWYFAPLSAWCQPLFYQKQKIIPSTTRSYTRNRAFLLGAFLCFFVFFFCTSLDGYISSIRSSSTRGYVLFLKSHSLSREVTLDKNKLTLSFVEFSYQNPKQTKKK